MSSLSSFLAWPFVAVWRMLAFVLSVTGRLVALVMGVLLIAFGAVISLTVVGAVVGVPLMLLGFLLLIRALF